MFNRMDFLNKHRILPAVMVACSMLFVLSCCVLQRNKELRHDSDSIGVCTDSVVSSSDTFSVAKLDSVRKQELFYALQHTDSMSLYVMHFPKQSDDSVYVDSLFSYPVEKCIRKISKEQRAVLVFLLTDDRMLVGKCLSVRQPFFPKFIVCIAAPKGNVYLLFSLGTEEMGFSSDGMTYSTYMITDFRSVLRWIDAVLPDMNILTIY